MRNPMQAILAEVQVLLHAGEGHNPRSDLIDIQRQVQGMDRLIQDLLDVTRIESGILELERETVQPGQLLDDALRRYQPLASEASLTLKRELDPGTPE